MKPTLGRTVHYMLPDGRSKGQLRPAVIVRCWSDTCVNLRVLLDGDNDDGAQEWATSRIEGTDPGTWRWPERV